MPWSTERRGRGVPRPGRRAPGRSSRRRGRPGIECRVGARRCAKQSLACVPGPGSGCACCRWRRRSACSATSARPGRAPAGRRACAEGGQSSRRSGSGRRRPFGREAPAGARGLRPGRRAPQGRRPPRCGRPDACRRGRASRRSTAPGVVRSAEGQRAAVTRTRKSSEDWRSRAARRPASDGGRVPCGERVATVETKPRERPSRAHLRVPSIGRVDVSHLPGSEPPVERQQRAKLSGSLRAPRVESRTVRASSSLAARSRPPRPRGTHGERIARHPCGRQ